MVMMMKGKERQQGHREGYLIYPQSIEHENTSKVIDKVRPDGKPSRSPQRRALKAQTVRKHSQPRHQRHHV